MDRDTIFISHATPDDNEFVRWLGGELTARGYAVWADVFHLKGGTPFWTTIEDTLRKRAIKVIFVVSRGSIDPSRSGVRNELSVADGLRKALKDPGFIVPVRIDDTPFDELPIQIHQLNTLDFSTDRDSHLVDLLDTLDAAGLRPGTAKSAAGAKVGANGNIKRYWVDCVAREEEAANVAALLERHRLISILGSGGVGKTTLALSVAELIADRFSDGVWVIDLASVTGDALLESAVIQTMGIDFQPEVGHRAAILGELRGKSALLLFDNCEHLYQAAGDLAGAILRDAEGVRILATTQVPLAIRGEHIFKLSPFTVSSGQANADPDAQSARFLVHCYEALGETITDRELPLVQQLCRRLDGVALALKMAAAQAATLGLETVDRQLAIKIDALSSEDQVSGGRHRSLTASMEWSYNLLGKSEQTSFRALGVFQGSFDLAAAISVAGPGSERSFLELVKRSMVVRASADRSRYRLLETARHFALALLTGAGEDEAARRRHAMHFRDHFAAGLASWETVPDNEWLARYQLDGANIRSALDWIQPRDPTLYAELAVASYRFWYQSELPLEGQRVAASALESPGLPQRMRALLHVAEVVNPADRQGLDEAIAYFRQAGETRNLVEALIRDVNGLLHLGRFDDARMVLAEVDGLAVQMAPSKLKALALVIIGAGLWVLGEKQAGERKVEAGLAMHAAFGNIGGRWKSAVKAAEVLHSSGFDLEAIGVTERILPEVQKEGSGYFLALIACNLAAYYFNVAKPDTARAFIVEAKRTLPQEDRVGTLCVIQSMAELALYDGEPRRAALILGYADHGFEALGGRQNTERRQRERIGERLRDELGEETLSSSLAEGASMDEFEARRQAEFNAHSTIG